MGARARGTWRRQAGPTGQREREGVRACECGLALTGGVHLSGDTGAHARDLVVLDWDAWTEMAFFHFS
jgi:hypothetical protein